MKELLFLKPGFKETVWGGNLLRTEYGYNTPSNHTGECWAISAHPNGDCIIDGGAYDSLHLSQLWEQQPEFFGYTDITNKKMHFPF